MSLRAEWTKLRTGPGSAWLLVAIIALTLALGFLADAAARCQSAGCGLDPIRTSLTGIYLGQAVVVILGVLTIGGEYSSGMIRVTFTAMPHRINVLVAKAVVLSGLVLVSGTLAVLGSLVAGRLILPGHIRSAALFTLGDAPVLRAGAGTVLYLALIALLSLGAATALRDTAAAIGIVLGLLYVFPIITTAVKSPSWHRHLEQIAPMTAGLAIQDTTGLRDLPIGPWAGLGVLGAWAAAALLAGGLALRLRDA
jgi:ABC-2 type transport system permease protein